jgi:Family of unknown function (DUF6167)
MARTFWFVAGAGAGAYALTRARRVAESLTANGLRDRVNGLAVGARIFRDEVAAGQAEKETELRERLGPGLTGHDRGIPELGSEGSPARTSTTDAEEDS